MNEASERIRNSLAELHDALSSSENVDPEARQLLVHALDEIHHALERGPAPAAAGQESSVTARLSSTARDFEETHPTLSGMIGSLIDALAQMGI